MNKFATHNSGKVIDIDGTFLVGTLNIDYYKLVEIFGEPLDGDGYKIDAIWELLFNNKTVATIYNWKTGVGYCGSEGILPDQVTEWHIGGKSSKALSFVIEAINNAIS